MRITIEFDPKSEATYIHQLRAQLDAALATLTAQAKPVPVSTKAKRPSGSTPLEKKVWAALVQAGSAGVTAHTVKHGHEESIRRVLHRFLGDKKVIRHHRGNVHWFVLAEHAKATPEVQVKNPQRRSVSGNVTSQQQGMLDVVRENSGTTIADLAGALDKTYPTAYSMVLDLVGKNKLRVDKLNHPWKVYCV